MSGENQKKHLKRRFISLDDKIKILNKLKNGEKPSFIGKTLNINEATIRTIKKNEIKIRKNVAEGCSLGAKRVARTRDIDMVRMEHALMVWFDDCIGKRIPLSGDMIKQKALKIYKHLKEIGQPSAENQNITFCASKGWFEKLKKRFSLHNIKFQGEKASASADAAHKFTRELAEIVSVGQYTADHIFNADDTTLYWKKLPSRTYISNNKNRAAGFKASKDRITLHMCSNMSGNLMVKPMLINRSYSPRALKNRDKSNLPVFWRANKKSWMTKIIFEDWFNNCFIPDVENFMKKKNMSFKILLLVDNASSHSRELEHPNVKIIFSPPNCTSLIQPLDQGIIATLKAYYIRLSFQTIFERLENDENKTIVEIWKEFSILDCIQTISSTCMEVKPSTLNAGWKALLPEMVQRENAVPPAQVEYTRIVNAASRIAGEGFVDITIQDVEELFEEQTLNEEELVELIDIFTSNVNDNSENITNESVSSFDLNDVQKGIQLAEQLEQHFVENDPSLVRSGKFRRELQSCLALYVEVLKELQCQKTQLCGFNNEEISSDEDFQIMRRNRCRPPLILDDSDDGI